MFIEAQKTEVRILQEHIREYYKYLKKLYIHIREIYGALFIQSSEYDITLRATGAAIVDANQLKVVLSAWEILIGNQLHVWFRRVQGVS